MAKIKPPKWHEIYPVGTQAGDEEARFFKTLARNPKYEWRSVGALSRESSLSKERVEKILAKYYKKGLVFQNPANEDQWGYWERVPHMLPDKEKSISKTDQDSRIDKALKEDSVSAGGFAPVAVDKAQSIYYDYALSAREIQILYLKETLAFRPWISKLPTNCR
jgi:hypothetical protein